MNDNCSLPFSSFPQISEIRSKNICKLQLLDNEKHQLQLDQRSDHLKSSVFVVVFVAINHENRLY